MNRRRIKKALKRIANLPGRKYFILYSVNKIKALCLKVFRSTRVAYPSTIMLELTNQCNLSCITCPREYDFGKAMDKGSMSPENAKKIIDELWPYLDSIGLTGMGETFLFKEILQIIDYLKSKDKGIIISVSTNAVVPGFIEKIRPLIDKIDTIQVSVDGIGDVYESIRKGAEFKVLDENLEQLSIMCRGTGTDLMLNMVVIRENFRQMPLLVEYADKKGIKYLDFTLFNLAAVTGIESSYYEFYGHPEFLEVISRLDQTLKKTPGVYATKRNFRTDSGFRKCPFPWTHFYVCWNGFVPPCCAKPFPKEFNFGNAFDTGVMNILNNKGYKDFRNEWYRNHTPSFCTRCHFIGIEPVN